MKKQHIITIYIERKRCMKSRLVIEGNAVYEVDIDCQKKREQENERKQRKESVQEKRRKPSGAKVSINH